MTKEAIKDGLLKLGFSNGDVVFMHSSLRSLGRVEGGADTVIDAFVEVLGEKGLMIVPTHTPGCVIDNPKGWTFDPESTPSSVGAITNALWKRENARRSLHPTHSVAAIGEKAEELVANHDKMSTFGINGPHGRYVRWNAKLTFLGVDIKCNTTLHAIEDWVDITYMPTVQVRVLDKEKNKVMVVEVSKYPDGHRDFYLLDSKIKRLMHKKGIISEGMLGPCRVQVIKALDVVEVTCNALKEESDILLCNNADCAFCSREKEILTTWKMKEFTL